MIMFLILGLIISRCKTVYTIYTFTIIMGILSDIKASSVTKLNTSNKELESSCFIEEERTQVIGGFLGLVTSQYIYDLSRATYFIGYFVLIIFGTVISLNLAAYIITAFTGTLGDPIWGSIISEYSSNNRKKYLVVNRTYFIVRSIFYFITWLVCRRCVIKGMWTFKYLYMIICILIITTYVIANKVNKKVFNKTI